MTKPRRIDADDPEVRSLTSRAWTDTTNRYAPEVTIICRSCGTVLGAMDTTKFGPLFLSWWDVEPHSEAELNGRPLKKREYERVLEQAGWRVESVSGNPDRLERHGAAALLTLPPTMAEDCPDLMVRCEKHGDAILDRNEALSRLRTRPPRKKWKVTPSFPLQAYREPTPDPGLLSGPPIRSSITRRWSKGSTPTT